MKKLFSVLIIIIMVAMASDVFATAGSCTAVTSATLDSTNTKEIFKVLTFTCTFGTGADATTALTGSLTAAQAAELKGWMLLMGTTYNGATAPTALYDLYLKETVGSTAAAVDILGTAGMNRPGTAAVSSQFRPLADTTLLMPAPRPVLDTLTLTASGNAVESGAFTAQFIFVK